MQVIATAVPGGAEPPLGFWLMTVPFGLPVIETLKPDDVSVPAPVPQG